MAKLVMIALLLSGTLFGQDCLPLQKKLTFSGRLMSVDENGYRQWIGLRLSRPICVEDGPYTEGLQDIKWLQASVPDRGSIASRLNRLLRNNVLITGTLAEWPTGYQRALAVLEVQTVEPVDQSGKKALSAPEAPAPSIKDVAAYDVAIRTTKRLEKQVRETATGQRLMPASEYAHHSMTGDDGVMWTGCRDGYELRSSQIFPANSGHCGAPENLCSLAFTPHQVVTLKMHCVKLAAGPETPK